MLSKYRSVLVANRFLLVGSISTADGSSLVRLGDTTVVCGIKAEIAEPDLDAPEDGFLGIASVGPDTWRFAKTIFSPKPRPSTSLFAEIQTRTTFR